MNRFIPLLNWFLVRFGKTPIHIHKWVYGSMKVPVEPPVYHIKSITMENRHCQCGCKEYRTKSPVIHWGHHVIDNNKWVPYTNDFVFRPRSF